MTLSFLVLILINLVTVAQSLDPLELDGLSLDLEPDDDDSINKGNIILLSNEIILKLSTNYSLPDVMFLEAKVNNQKKLSTLSEEEKKVLEYLQIALVSRRILLTDSPEINFNFKLVKNFDEDFFSLENARKRLNKYRNKISNRIKLTNTFLISKVKRKIDEKLRFINKTLISLLNVMKNDRQLENHNWKELEDKFQTKNLLETLKILSRSLGFIACVYDKVLGNLIRYSLVLKPLDDSEKHLKKIPAALAKYVGTVTKKYQKLIQREWEVMKNALEIFKNEIKAKDDDKYRFIDKIFDICQENEYTKANKTNYYDYVNFTKSFKEKLMQNDDVNKTNSLNIFNNALTLSQLVQECYKNYTDTLGKLNLIKISQNVYIVNKFKQDIFEIFLPAFNDLLNGLDETNIIGLDIDNKWSFYSQLKSIKLFYEKRIKNVFKTENLNIILYAIHDCFNTLITLASEMRYFAHQAMLVAYMKDLESEVAGNITLNNEFEKIASDAKQIVETSIVLDYYNRSVNELIKFIFPITHPYLEHVQPASIFISQETSSYFPREHSLSNSTRKLRSLSLDKSTEQSSNSLIYNSDKSMNLDRISINVTQSVVYIEHLMKIFYTSRGNVPFFVHDQLFASLYRSSLPFFTWTQEKYPIEIRQFLAGNEILLYADVQDSFVDAIVCVQIGLNITTSNYQTNQLIGQKLFENYTLTMYHSGNSYYKCNKDYYLIKTDSLNLTFDYSLMERGTSNIKYFTEIKQFHKLSPFTLWTFQLNRKDKIVETMKEDWKEVVDDVFLELSGVGHFVAPDHYVHTNNLHKFYNKMEELSDDDCPK